MSIFENNQKPQLSNESHPGPIQNESRFGVHATANHVAKTRAVADSGSIPAGEKVDARTIVGLSANYRLTRNAKPLAELENLTDETYVAAIRPTGLCVGKPRTVMAGAQFDL